LELIKAVNIVMKWKIQLKDGITRDY
jgi:hypothetical protein